MLFCAAAILSVIQHSDVKNEAVKAKQNFHLAIADTTKELGKKVFMLPARLAIKIQPV